MVIEVGAPEEWPQDHRPSYQWCTGITSGTSTSTTTSGSTSNMLEIANIIFTISITAFKIYL